MEEHRRGLASQSRRFKATRRKKRKRIADLVRDLDRLSGAIDGGDRLHGVELDLGLSDRETKASTSAESHSSRTKGGGAEEDDRCSSTAKEAIAGLHDACGGEKRGGSEPTVSMKEG